MKKSLTLFMFIVLTVGMAFVSGVSAATINAASCSQADVNAAISASVTGDTVIVPSGSCTWTSPNTWTAAVSIPISKKIILQGQGIGNTTISYTTNSKMLTLNNGARITGFTFIEGRIEPTGHGWRIDHNRFERVGPCSINNTGVMPIGSASYSEAMTGVIDHNQFHNSRVYVGGTPYIIDYDHIIWARPLNLGTEEAVYVEDNEFTYADCAMIQAMDSLSSGDYVFRYNKVHNAYVEAHAVQGNNRASRKWEVYNNVFIADGVNSQGKTMASWVVGSMRGGTGVWFNNAVIGGVGYDPGQWPSPTIYIDEQRSCDSKSVSGKCDGSSRWDGNTPGMSGYPCRDQIGRSNDAVKWVSTPGGEGAYTQTLDPAYAWNNFRYPRETDRINKTNGVAVEFVVKPDICDNAKAHLREGRDFYNGTPKPGYTPYTYPHPLITAAAPAPAPPPAPALVPPPPPAPAPDVQPPPPATKSWWRRLLRK